MSNVFNAKTFATAAAPAEGVLLAGQKFINIT